MFAANGRINMEVLSMNKGKTILGSAIVLYFVIGFEILIMISPFAGFFYSAFNPILLGLAANTATRWLSAFFLPHMMVPPDGFLGFIRIAGSILFVGGMGVFLVCAWQVYTAKFSKKGVVLGGLYRAIRHPQYVGLAACGAGLCIMWPRFLVLVLWCLMVLVYYILARDEERRMLAAHEVTYRNYMENTGMFLPKVVEGKLMPRSGGGLAAAFVLMAAIVLGGAFGLRSYTIKHLPHWSAENVTALAVLPEDSLKMDHRMTDILGMDEIRTRIGRDRYLIYFIPEDYIMQGLIADTGGDWKLYKHHHTFYMIADWVLHPFRHLREGHHAIAHGEAHSQMSAAEKDGSVIRRLIVLKVDNEPEPHGTFTPLAIGVIRTPLFMADVDVHNLRLIDIRDLHSETGWGRVPTPTF